MQIDTSLQGENIGNAPNPWGLRVFFKKTTASARGADGGRVEHLTAPRFANEMWELFEILIRA